MKPGHVLAFRLFSVCALCLPLSSCAISRLGLHASQAILGETDQPLAAAAIPAFIKVAETAWRSYPNNSGYAINLASLHLLYASAILEDDAFYLLDSDYQGARRLQDRALDHYRRSAALIEPLVLKASPGLLTADINLGSGQELTAAQPELVRPFRRRDVEAMTYYAAAVLSAFALNPLDFDQAQKLPAAVLLIHRALELEPDYGEGMLLELAFTAFAALPEALGGDRERALRLYRPEHPGPGMHIAYALQVCVPEQDYPGFMRALERALELSQEPGQESLRNSNAARKATWLLDHAWLYLPDADNESEDR